MGKSLIAPLVASLVVLANCANPPRSTGCLYSNIEIRSCALNSLEHSNPSPKHLDQYRNVPDTSHRQIL